MSTHTEPPNEGKGMQHKLTLAHSGEIKHKYFYASIRIQNTEVIIFTSTEVKANVPYSKITCMKEVNAFFKGIQHVMTNAELTNPLIGFDRDNYVVKLETIYK